MHDCSRTVPNKSYLSTNKAYRKEGVRIKGKGVSFCGKFVICQMKHHTEVIACYLLLVIFRLKLETINVQYQKHASAM